MDPGFVRGVRFVACALALLSVSSPLAAQDAAFRLTLPPVDGPPTIHVIHTLDNPSGAAISAYLLATCFDPSVLLPSAIEPGSDLLDLTGGSIFFFAPEITAEEMAVGVVFSGVGATTIPAGVGFELTRLVCGVVTFVPGAVAPVEYCDFTTTPPLQYTNVVVDAGVSVVPDLLYGDPLDQDPPIIRGEGNGDGSVDIADALHTLGFLFQSGAPGRCHDSMDANDSGAVDLADPVHLLAYLFGGGPPIPSPYPLCGYDPTPDFLPCAGTGGGC